MPDQRWDVISVDFVGELPEANGFDAIMNVVDSVSKRAHFIPTNTVVTALGAARIYLQHVWKLHGLPRSVVLDRRPQFVAEFTREVRPELWRRYLTVLLDGLRVDRTELTPLPEPPIDPGDVDQIRACWRAQRR